MAKMYEANMRDFVVWLHEESGTMFHQFHYVGDDFDADMKKCAAAPALWTASLSSLWLSNINASMLAL